MTDLLYFTLDTFDAPTGETFKAGLIAPPIDTAQRDRILAKTPRVAVNFAAIPAELLTGDIDLGGSAIIAAGLNRTGFGSAAAPSYAFTGDTDTGFYRDASDRLGVSTGGTARLYIAQGVYLGDPSEAERSDGFPGLSLYQPGRPSYPASPLEHGIRIYTTGGFGAYTRPGMHIFSRNGSCGHIHFGRANRALAGDFSFNHAVDKFEWTHDSTIIAFLNPTFFEFFRGAGEVRFGIGNRFSNRATLDLHSNGDVPADINFGINSPIAANTKWLISARAGAAGTSGTSSGQLVFYRMDANTGGGSSAAMVFQGNGFVGLGAGFTDPTVQFHVRGEGSTSQIALERNGVGQWNWGIGSPSNMGLGGAGAAYIVNTGAAARRFGIRVGLAGAPAAFLLDTNGRWANGAFEPDRPVHIRAGSATELLHLEVTSGNFAGLKLTSPGRSWEFYVSNSINHGGGTHGLGFFDPTAGAYGLEVAGGTRLVRMRAYGAGTASFDSNGVLASSSDPEKKDVIGPVEYKPELFGQITPRMYRWKESSGFDPDTDYAGFLADDLTAQVPGAVFGQPGSRTLMDRALIAQCWMANADLLEWRALANDRLDDHETRIAALEAA